MKALNVQACGFLFFLSVFCFCFPAAADPVEIGVLAALTGVRADGGAYIKNGLTLAQEQINNDPRRKYQLRYIFEDTEYSARLAVTAFHKVKDVNRVDYIIGGQGSSEALAIAPLAEQSKTIFISPSSGSDELTTAGDFIFRTQYNVQQEAPVNAETIFRHRRGSQLAIIAIDTAITPAYLRYFTPAFEKLGGSIVRVMQFQATDVDLRPYLILAKNLGAQDVFVIGAPIHMGYVMRQAAEMGFKAQFYGIGVEGDETIKVAGKDADGLIYPYSFDADSGQPRTREFVNKYLLQFKGYPDTIAANAYDAAYLLSDCFEKVGTQTDRVRDCLYQTKDYIGAGGILTIDRNGDAVKPLFIKTIRNGRFVRLE